MILQNLLDLMIYTTIIIYQALLEEVKGRKPTLTALVSCGRALEDYVQENGAVGVADIGYTKVEQRYDTLQVGL